MLHSVYTEQTHAQKIRLCMIIHKSIKKRKMCNKSNVLRKHEIDWCLFLKAPRYLSTTPKTLIAKKSITHCKWVEGQQLSRLF